MRKHRAGTGAKFTRSYPPETLLGAKRFASKGEALSMEHQLRRLTPVRKRALACAWSKEGAVEDPQQMAAVPARAASRVR